ncbi:hypothetical protein GQ607_004862 [Colletotrichum asianum]|uniref:Uncharacterized protein n=1 Tax=Colletotrichum asianum TaxID=702518 RepID=A0A8H3ZV88_9PEZI|nr:hypothetical protein GQ607_004862 [Colletotrichum asianum]
MRRIPSKSRFSLSTFSVKFYVKKISTRSSFIFNAALCHCDNTMHCVFGAVSRRGMPLAYKTRLEKSVHQRTLCKADASSRNFWKRHHSRFCL